MTEDDELTFTTSPAFVASVDAPSSVNRGSPVLIKVRFPVSNGCGTFERFDVSGTIDTKNIEVIAKYYDGICTQATQLLTVDYLFDPQTSGSYTLNFKSSPTDFITVGINVN